MEDKTLTCKDCGTNFTFTSREQQFYADKGFTNEPQRCKDCRISRKGQSGGGSYRGDSGPRPSFDAVCAECGVATTVPFKPRGDRPVYCKACFTAHSPASV